MNEIVWKGIDSILLNLCKLKKKQLENIDLNPELKRNCEQDVQYYCKDKSKDEVLECLRKRKTKLTQKCRKHVFKIQVCLLIFIFFNIIL